MTSLRVVPQLDLNKLVKEGHDPTTFVLTDQSSVCAMEEIADLRHKNKENFEAFDKAIIDFANMKTNIQSERTYVTKKKAYDLIKAALPKKPGANLFFCGSTMNKCGVESCDVDLCWAIPSNSEVETDCRYPMVKQGRFFPEMIMREAFFHIENVDCIRNASIVNARVGIIKFDITVDGITLPCDININNIAGIYNTFLLSHYAKIDERFSMLTRVLKKWGKRIGIINSQRKYFNSYTMSLMVLHFLQCGVSPPILPNLVALRPDLFGGDLDLEILADSYDLDLNITMRNKNTTPIGDLLLGFFRYYGTFDYESEGIILCRACVAPKPNRDFFYLEEVYDGYTVPKNLNAHRLQDIKLTFLEAYLYGRDNRNFSDLLDGKFL